MEQLPKIARQRLAQQRAESDHPAADVLAAFVERSLAEDERERVLGHLARCAECRDVVALAMPEAEPALRDALPQERAWHEWWVFRVGGLAAALVVIMVAVLLVRPHPRKGEEASVAAKLQTSETSSPSAAGTSTNAAPGDERAKSVQGGDKFAASARQAAVPRSPEQQATKVDNAEDKSSQAANAQNALRPYAGLRGRASKDVLGAAQSANHAAITAPKPLSRTDSRVVGGATAAKVSPAQPLAPEAANRPLERDESVQKNEQQQAQQQQQQ
ncbi:MAG: zf-HC2 domain-containing protein, partial [Acidobacteria bacterium]|nr:zf-HC2 domain-containing protein [Acidobacteriota bacterium]